MSDSPDEFVYRATLDRVIDGDTFDCVLDLGFDVKLNKQRVRLAGIDTPESRTRDPDEKGRGKLAGSFLQSAIDNGTNVVIQTNNSSQINSNASTVMPITPIQPSNSEQQFA